MFLLKNVIHIKHLWFFSIKIVTAIIKRYSSVTRWVKTTAMNMHVENVITIVNKRKNALSRMFERSCQVIFSSFVSFLLSNSSTNSTEESATFLARWQQFFRFQHISFATRETKKIRVAFGIGSSSVPKLKFSTSMVHRTEMDDNARMNTRYIAKILGKKRWLTEYNHFILIVC